jgi:hypothetical protein
MRVMNIDLSSCRFTAPGMVSKKAGHPHPDALICQLELIFGQLLAYNFWLDLYRGASHPAQADDQLLMSI